MSGIPIDARWRLAAVLLLSAGLLGQVAVGARAAPQLPVVVVVAATSPVSEMSAIHLADIYLGRTNRFPNGDPCEPIDLPPRSPQREAFYAMYLGRSPAEVKAHWSRIIFTGRGRPPRDAASARELMDLVAGKPGAIGYVERHLVDRRLRVVRIR